MLIFGGAGAPGPGAAAVAAVAHKGTSTYQFEPLGFLTKADLLALNLAISSNVRFCALMAPHVEAATAVRQRDDGCLRLRAPASDFDALRRAMRLPP